MRISRDSEGVTMSSGLICPNDSESNVHYKPTFEIMENGKYKCENCGAVLIIQEPVLIHGHDGRLKMETRIEIGK